MIEKIQDWATNNGENCVFTIFFFLAVSFIGYKICIFIINQVSKRIDPTALHWKLIKSIVKVLWIFLFIFGIIQSFPEFEGISTALVAGGSAVVVAVGLASQNAIGDALDGVFISIFKPFAVGDRVKLVSRNIVGTICDINLRYTSIKTVENNILMIPNSIMNDEIIENSNIEDTRIKAFLDVQISYESNVQLAKQLLSDIIVKHPLYVDGRSEEEKKNGTEMVSILVRNLSTDGIELRATVCSSNINDSFKLCSDLREQLLIVFAKHNIVIPYHTVNVVGGNNR